MQGLIQFIKRIVEAFKTAKHGASKTRGGGRPMPQCTECGEVLYPEEIRARICSECVDAQKREAQEA